jgi:pantothenate kinase/uncharacterized DUF497 family protein
MTSITRMIQDRAQNSDRFIVAINGAPGSGKSTLAEHIREELCRAGETAIVVPMDGFHFDDVILNERGDRLRKGAPFTFDVHGFINLLRRIRAREPEIAIPVFHREQEAAHAGERIISRDTRIVLVEGNYLLLRSKPWNQLIDFFDLTIALNVPEDELERRLIQRWLDCGFDMDAASERVASNDMLNVKEVMSNSALANYNYPCFCWNPDKATINLEKHHVSFPEASTVFEDVLSVTFPDPDHSLDEERYVIIGMSDSAQLLIVSHTDRENCICIISARSANRQEKRFYEEGN